MYSIYSLERFHRFLLSKRGRHRRFQRYPIAYLPCPDLSGFRHSRSENVSTLRELYHKPRLERKH